MSNAIWTSMKNIDNVTTTTNGDKSYKSSLNGLMDLMFKAGVMKNKYETDAEAIRLFANAFEENPIYAIRLLFYVRDIRGGQGCRNFFRQVMNFIAANLPGYFTKIVDFIPEYGRWDDMIYILNNSKVSKEIKNLVLNHIKEQFIKDLKNIKDNKSISLLMKWMPSENASSSVTIGLAKQIRNFLKIDSKTYRKALSLGRNYINIIEHNICQGPLSDVDYSKVPSKAMMKYKNIFKNKDNIRFEEYLSKLQKGETKVNASTLYPYDIIHEMYKCLSTFNYYGENNEEHKRITLLNEQWKALPNFFENKSDNSIVVADVSGSMSGTPIEVCISLALYIAERNHGVFHNKVITFSAQPELVEIPECLNTLEDRINFIQNISWGMNTNLDKVFKLLFNAVQKTGKVEDLPSSIYIISDMQFDMAFEHSGDETVFEKWQRKFAEIGVELPKVIFWNVSEFECNTCPITINNSGAVCISGFSPSIIKYIMGSDLNNTLALIETIVLSPRYNKILSE